MHRAAGKECSVAIYYSMVTSTFPGAGQIIDKCDATVPVPAGRDGPRRFVKLPLY